MIFLDAVNKAYGNGAQHALVLNNVSATFEPGKHYTILGQAGAGKSTLLRLLCGLQWPSSGLVHRTGIVSPPLGSLAVLTLKPTVRGVIAFCANLYNVNTAELMNFVIEFAELDEFLDAPIISLPAMERVAPSYAIGYGIPADFYLIDGAPSGGRESIRRKCMAAYEERLAHAGTIFATRNIQTLPEHTEHVAVLHNGTLTTYDRLEDAIEMFSRVEIDAMQGTLSAAEYMTRQGNMTGALHYLENYVSVNVEDLAGHKMRADVALRSQNFAVAKEALLMVVELTPDDKDAHLSLVRAAERDGDLPLMASSLIRYLKMEPADPAARTALARCYERLDQKENATRLWHRIFADSDSLAEATTAIRACIRLDDWSATFRMLDHALERWPDDLPLLTMAAKICLQISRPAEFIDTVLRMAEVDIQKAVGRAAGAITKLRWENIVTFLEGIQKMGRIDEVDEAAIKRFLLQLERHARSADKDNREAEAQSIRAAIRLFQTDKSAIV